MFCAASWAESLPLRIMAANITSGNYQSYMAPGERIFQGLTPDVVLIQEFNIGESASQDTTVTSNWVSSVFGAEFAWFREPGGDHIPNGVISRWPILASGEIENPTVGDRDTAWAQIDLPGESDLWVFSCHLHTSPSSDQRYQAQRIDAYIQTKVPAKDYVVVGGDFNGTSALSELSTLVTSSPFPADQEGNTDTNASRSSHYDFVLVDPKLDALETPVRLGTSRSYASGLVFDSRVYTPLSEASPVQSGDSGVSGMQHMAVVRDFVISTTPDDFHVSGEAVDFGQRNATQGPFVDQSISLSVTNPFTLTGVGWSGAKASEFTLVSPDLSGGAAAISSATPLVFRWTPAANDAQSRSVVATFTSDASPSQFQVTLTGSTPAAFSVSGTSVNFGSVDAGDGAVLDTGLVLTVNSAFKLTGVSWSGAQAGEFELLNTLNTSITSSTPLRWRWTPAANDGQMRSVVATVTTDAIPAQFTVTLTGRPLAGAVSGESLDISGYRVDMDKDGTVTSLTFPADTVLSAGGVVVIGRDATQTEFEVQWGALPEGTLYFNGMDLVGGNGFPLFNSNERSFSVFDPQGAQVDPASGQAVVVAASTSGKSYQRTTTDANSFSLADQAAASPGLYAGTQARTGRLVISEISDASEYPCEFIELYFDAPPAPQNDNDVRAWMCFN